MRIIGKILHKIRKQNERFKICLLLFAFNWAVLFIFVTILLIVNIIPIKYILAIFLVLIVIYATLGYMLFNENQYNLTRKVAQFLSVGVSIILVTLSFYLNAVGHFFREIQMDESDSVTYSLISLKNSSYASLALIQYIRVPIGIVSDENTKEVEERFNTEKLEERDKEMHLAKAIDNVKVKETLEELSKYQQEYIDESSPGDLIKSLFDKKVPFACIERSYIDLMSEEIDGFEDKIKINYEFDVDIDESDSYLDNKKIKDLRYEPFVMYINGIDKFKQDAAYTSVHGRNEINILMVVNPMTDKVLIINIPPDYYLQVADGAEVKDRLSNIGVYGIQKSIRTVENLFGVNVNYYFQFNFEDIVPLVDAIEGITINSPMAFQIENSGGLSIDAGDNYLNGKQALTYARSSRSKLIDNSNHIDNQRQVLNAIVEKITTSNVLFRNFSPILMEADKAFRTNMNTNELANLTRMQLEFNPKWEVEIFDVDGDESTLPTFTLGNDYPLQVIIPNELTLNEAKARIRNVLQGEV